MKRFISFLTKGILLPVSLLRINTTLHAQAITPFGCSNLAYQSISAGTTTRLYSYNAATGVRTAVGSPSTANYNGIGYNPTDNFIYGVRGLNQIAKIDANGNTTLINVPNMNGGGSGDVTPDGYFALITSTSYAYVDVNPARAATYGRIVNSASATYPYPLAAGTTASPYYRTYAGVGSLVAADFAYNPADSSFYGLGSVGSGQQFKILKIKPGTATATVGATVTGGSIQAETAGFGSAFIDASGSLYVFANSLGRFYRINIAAATAAQVAQFTPESINDGAICPQALFVNVTLSGNVFNDMNGLSDNTVNGAGINPGGLYAVLWDITAGKVLDTVAVASNGIFTLAATPSRNYNVIITTSATAIGATTQPASVLPAGWRSTGERLGTGAGSDGTPNGVLAVSAGSANVANVSFGINQSPVATADALTGQPPGSPATVANILANDTDPNGGTLSPGNISLVAPTGATSVATDAQGDVTGFTVPNQGTWALNSSGAVTFTPQTGFTGDPTPISYTVRDNAGLTSNAVGITIDFNPPVTVSGTVYNDNNGMTGGPDGTAASGITVTLYAANGTTVLATTTTDAGGNYSFPNQVPGNYVVGVMPPAGYQDVSSTDATPADGKTSVTVDSAAVANVSFGINQPPGATADALTGQPPGSPATIANILANDTDPNGGTLSPGNISLVAPTGATGITTDAQGDVTGFTVPNQGTWSLNSSTGAVTFTPQTGFTGDPTPISYTVRDNAGLNSNIATVSIGFAAIPRNAAVTLIKNATPDTGIPFGFATSSGPVSLIDSVTSIAAYDISFTSDGKLLVATEAGAVYTLANGATGWLEPAPGNGRVAYIDGGANGSRFIGASLSPNVPIKITSDGGATYTEINGFSSRSGGAVIDSIRFFAGGRQMHYYDGTAYYPKAYPAYRMDYLNNTVVAIDNTLYRTVVISQNTTLSSAEDGTLTEISPSGFGLDVTIGQGLSPENPGLNLIYATTSIPNKGVQYYTGTGDTEASWISLPEPPGRARSITTDPSGRPWITMNDGRIAAWTGKPADTIGTWKLLQVRSNGPGNFVNFFGLPPGTFQITENAPTGNYTLQNILHEGSGTSVADVANRTDSLTLAEHDHAFETFTNQALSLLSSRFSGLPVAAPAQHLVLYPNPARDLLTVEHRGGQIRYLTVYNTFGQTVYHTPVAEANRHQVSTATFAPGVYMIRVATDKGEEIRKFEIQR